MSAIVVFVTGLLTRRSPMTAGATPACFLQLSAAVQSAFDLAPYSPYSVPMKPLRKGAEEARAQLPELLTAAAQGRQTIITRHGKPVAVLMPVSAISEQQQRSLLPLEGTGRGLWGPDSRETLRQLKDEWDR